MKHPWGLEVLWATIVKFAGLLIVVYGFGVIGFQTIGWLRDGVWTPLELRIEWEWLWGLVGVHAPQPQFSWLGVQRIAAWLLETPLSVGIIVSGIVVFGIGLGLDARVSKQIAEFNRVTRSD